jgi:hypothetical protein
MNANLYRIHGHSSKQGSDVRSFWGVVGRNVAVKQPGHKGRASAGQAGVIDRDVHVLPASAAAPMTGGPGALAGMTTLTCEAMPSTTLNPAKLPERSGVSPVCAQKAARGRAQCIATQRS